MKIIGHRGAKGLAPENTAASIKAALDAGVDMIEFDVRVTADGVPVLIHNASLSRANDNIILSIAKTGHAQLLDTKPDLITLANALALTNGRVPLIVEVKRHVSTGPIIKAIQEALSSGYPPKHIWLASKDFKILRALYAAFPDLTFVVIDAWSGVRATYRARHIGANHIAMNSHFLWSGFIRMMSRRFKLYAYTVNNPALAKKLIRYGVSGIITDNPTLLKSTFERKK